MQRFEELCDAINKDILECPICFETLRQPRTLPCQHTFCDPCLRRHLSASGSHRTLICPTCRSNVNLKRSGVDSLPLNNFMGELQSELEKLRRDSFEANAQFFSCERCNAFLPSSMKIRACKACVQPIRARSVNGYSRLSSDEIRRLVYLCRLSYYTHKSFVSTASVFQKRPVTFWGENRESVIAHFELRTCAKVPINLGFPWLWRPNSQYRSLLYCETCTEFVCESCEAQHSEHDILPLIADIVRYMEHFKSLPDTVISSDKSIDLNRIDEFHRAIVSMYLNETDRHVSDTNVNNNLTDRRSSHISLKKLESKFLVCSICSKRYSEPKILVSCQHCFCANCLLTYWKSKSSIRSLPCPVCAKKTDLPNGIDNLPNVCVLNELMTKFDMYNADTVQANVSSGEQPEYGLPYRCDVCHASCSEIVDICIVCKIFVFPVMWFLGNIQQRQYVTVKKEVYDRILCHIDCLTEASLLSSLRMPYDRCITCNLHFMNPNNDMWCNDCHDTVCPSCMQNSHIGHQIRKTYTEAEVMLEHATTLSSFCDRISRLKPCFVANGRRERNWLAVAKHKVVGTWWAFRPFAKNNVAQNERRMLSVIWKFPHNPLKLMDIAFPFFCFFLLIIALLLQSVIPVDELKRRRFSNF